MLRRNKIFTSIPVLLLAACAADVSEGDLDVGGLEQPSICGAAAPSWIHVESYTNGQLGPDKMSEAFVDAHEKPVGHVRWANNVQTKWANPQSITNGLHWCTGTLIARDLFLTAGHCVDQDTTVGSATPTDATGTPIPPAQLVTGQEVVFHYQLEKATGTVDLAGDPYPVVSLEDWSNTGSMDYAIIRLGPNAAGQVAGDKYGWARVAAVTPQPGDELTIIQHPYIGPGANSEPKVVDTGTTHSTTADGTVNYEDFDVMGGTSGAGILDWQGRLIGVHNRSSTVGGVRTCGPGLPNMGTLIEAILPQSPLLSELTREVGDHSEVLAAGDFNKDGFNDVVVGAPTRAVAAPITGNPVEASGAVRVIYGDANGPDISTEQWLDQNMSASPGFAETGDFFGAAVAVGDFNKDLYADLAVGAPGEDTVDPTTFAITRNAGGVWIFYGGPGGLSGASSVNFDQEDTNITEVSEVDDRMGAALATGDFNKDGRDDLAIGTPGETIGANAASGMVTILYGSATGLVSTGNQQFDQNSAIAAGEAEAGDRFGSALASGDFDKDGSKDLAIGTPYEDLGANPAGGAYLDAGSISVLYGSTTKLKWRANSRFYQGSVGGLEGLLERGDRLGTSLAAGDLNGDLMSDLIVGAPGEDIGTNMHAGFIHAIYGTLNTGLTANGDVGLSEESPSVPGNPESEDRLGMSVSVAHVNAYSPVNRALDVLVGAPGEIIGGVHNAGMVIELFGRQGAVLSGTGSVAFHQNTTNVWGDAEAGDRLGAVVLAKDLTLDGYAEGIFSAIGEDVGLTPPVATPQIFHLFFGSGTGLTTTGNLLFP